MKKVHEAKIPTCPECGCRNIILLNTVGYKQFEIGGSLFENCWSIRLIEKVTKSKNSWDYVIYVDDPDEISNISFIDDDTWIICDKCKNELTDEEIYEEKKTVEIYWEYDGWRIEIYHGDLPQCSGDTIISNNNNLSNAELYLFAMERVIEEGKRIEDYIYKIIEQS